MCMVKGCRNIGCYTLTAGREFGNSVIICGDCLKKANKEVEKLENAAVEKKAEETVENINPEPETEKVTEAVTEATADAEAESKITEKIAEPDEPAGEEKITETVAEPEPAEEKKPSPAKKKTAKKGTKK